MRELGRLFGVLLCATALAASAQEQDFSKVQIQTV